jgi:peptidyl-tRNA hydrolase
MGMGKVAAKCSHAAVSLQAGPAQKPRATDAMGVLWTAEIVVKAPYEDSLIEPLTHAKVGLSAPRCREDTDSTRVPYSWTLNCIGSRIILVQRSGHLGTMYIHCSKT